MGNGHDTPRVEAPAVASSPMLERSSCLRPTASRLLHVSYLVSPRLAYRLADRGCSACGRGPGTSVHSGGARLATTQLPAPRAELPSPRYGYMAAVIAAHAAEVLRTLCSSVDIHTGDEGVPLWTQLRATLRESIVLAPVMLERLGATTPSVTASEVDRWTRTAVVAISVLAPYQRLTVRSPWLCWWSRCMCAWGWCVLTTSMVRCAGWVPSTSDRHGRASHLR